MAFKIRVLTVNRMVALGCFSFVLMVYLPAWSDQPPKGGGVLPQYEALSHAEEGLKATKDKDLKAAAKHFQMAIDAAQRAETGADETAQKEYEKAIKSLQEALKQAQAGDADAASKAAGQAIAALSPCEGGQCSINTSTGCGCAVEGMQNCNPFYPYKRCTTSGCNCYCM